MNITKLYFVEILGWICVLIIAHLTFLYLEIYPIIGWLDMLMHFCAGLIIGFLGICFMWNIKIFHKQKFLKIIIVPIVMVLFIGSMWEILEFNSTALFGFELAKIQNFEDTLSDMFCNVLGALTGIIQFWVKKRHQHTPAFL